jgi:hypothetical protein
MSTLVKEGTVRIRAERGNPAGQQELRARAVPAAVQRGALDIEALAADTMRRFPLTMARLAE